jgi:hypothetical protein
MTSARVHSCGKLCKKKQELYMEYLVNTFKSREVRDIETSFIPENIHGSQATDICYKGVPLALLKSM